MEIGIREWIPVKNTLPKVGGNYLVTYYGKYSNFMPLVKECKYLNGKFSIENVIAWRELPLPYSGN